MKYIRTKDGIFEVVKEDGDWLEIISNFEREAQCHCIIKKHAVIKQADTIEDLCDEFTCIKYGAYGKLHPLVLDDFEILKRENNYPTAQIYGAIWTDKGLIYVAKMNDKGELELL